MLLKCPDVTRVWQLAVMPTPALSPGLPRVASNDTFLLMPSFFNLSREESGGGLWQRIVQPGGNIADPGLLYIELSKLLLLSRDVRSVLSLAGIFLVIVDTEDTIGLCGELRGRGRELTILPFNASYYSRDSDSDGTQQQTLPWNAFSPKGCERVFLFII